MPLEPYPNLRALFHVPGFIPPSEFARDHDNYVVKLEHRFSGPHKAADCPYCQQWRKRDSTPLNDRKEDSIPLDAPRAIRAVKWLEQSPYNPFNGELMFDHWRDRYTQALEQVKKKIQKASPKKPSCFAEVCRTDIDRAFFALLRKADIEEIEHRIDVQAYADIDEMYFLAGFYGRPEELNLPCWQKRKGERVRLGLIDYAKAPPLDVKDFHQRLEQAARVDTITREHRNRLCDEFQQAGMIGNSDAIVQLYLEIEQICKAARMWPNQPAIYICGNPGTGKELAAHGIHRLSKRKGKIVTCNCAAFPPELIESELFGHVKGAFTGATADKKGLFEEAHGGTLFLDEINKMMDLNQQGKLLRALEYGEIRKVGSNKTEKVDVLTVVAANVDLDEQVKNKHFLPDLRSRLIPDPICVPSLLKRTRDVPLLVKHFLEQLPGTPLEDYRFPVALWCMEKLKQLQEGFEVRDLLNEVRRLASQAGAPDGLEAKLEAAVQKLRECGKTVSVTELSRFSGISRHKLYENPLRDMVASYETQGIVKKQQRPTSRN